MLYPTKSTISGKYKSIFPKSINPYAFDSSKTICNSNNLTVISQAPLLATPNTSWLFLHLAPHHPFCLIYVNTS